MPKTTPTLCKSTERHLHHYSQPDLPVLEHVFFTKVAARPRRHEELFVFVGIIAYPEEAFEPTQASWPFELPGREPLPQLAHSEHQ